MITKFVLVVWLGWGQTQTLSIDHYDTLAECEAVQEAVLRVTSRARGKVECEPYSFEAPKARNTERGLFMPPRTGALPQ